MSSDGRTRGERPPDHGELERLLTAEFLRRMPISEPGCVILDLRLPDASGLELQEMLAKASDILLVLFVTGHGDVPAGVRTRWIFCAPNLTGFVLHGPGVWIQSAMVRGPAGR